jgi:hypothetical protein
LDNFIDFRLIERLPPGEAEDPVRAIETHSTSRCKSMVLRLLTMLSSTITQTEPLGPQVQAKQMAVVRQLVQLDANKKRRVPLDRLSGGHCYCAVFEWRGCRSLPCSNRSVSAHQTRDTVPNTHD